MTETKLVTGLITFGDSLIDTLGAVTDLRAAGYRTEVIEYEAEDETVFIVEARREVPVGFDDFKLLDELQDIVDPTRAFAPRRARYDEPPINKREPRAFREL